jgi:hypothetical protein
MKSKKNLFAVLLMLLTTSVFSQSKDYKCCIQNIKTPDSKTIEFDIYLEWNGMDSPKFTLFQAGIDFNYDVVANGGTVTGFYKPESADNRLPKYQRYPKWKFNETSKQIRLLAAIAPDSIAIVIPPSPGIKLGTFVLQNTVPFKDVSKLNFEWSFGFGSATKTKTMISVYQPGLAMPKDITVPGNHCVKK